MAFALTCPHKGCHKHTQPYIDPKTDKVYCGDCDQEITNITHFVKVQLKSLKQYAVKKNSAFSTKCPKCGLESQPKEINKEIVCGKCNKPLDNLTPIFKNMLRDKLKEAGKDI